MDRALVKIDGNGVELATREWPGTGSPGLLLAHATGFCKEVWTPVVEELRLVGNALPVVAFDQRSHGESSRSALPIDWWDLADDALAIIESVDGPCIGVGHSLGAAALLMAEIRRPGTLDLIVAIEPIVFPPPYGSGDNHPLAVSARRRRARFPSPEEARANFANKELFAGWDDRALDGYISGGLRPVADEWELACLPDHEASFYAGTGTHQAWDRLGELRVPVLLVVGSASDSHTPPYVEALASQIPDVETTVLAGAGHLLPMEEPVRLAAIINQATAATTSS